MCSGNTFPSKARWLPGPSRKSTTLLALGLVLILAACGAAHQTTPNGRTTSTGANRTAVPTHEHLPPGNDWTQYRYDLTGTGLNPEGRITAATSSQLKLVWTATGGGFLATPAIVDGVVYATTQESLHAYDLLTGALKWQSKDIGEGLSVNSSVAVDKSSHTAYFGTASARVIAIDTDDGSLRWNAQLANPAAGAYIWTSPLLANGKLYIGLASHTDHPCVRGAIYALDPHTGVLLWTHYTVPDGVLGGAVWSSFTADPAAHTLVVTTGNPCPWGPVTYESDSILGLNWDSGQTLWQYQAIAQDNCDCDFGEGAVIYTYNGQQYMVAGSKYGAVYAIHPPTTAGGAPTLAWTANITFPGFIGTGGIFQPPAYSSGLVFFAGGPTLDNACPVGAIHAFRADTGALVWRDCTPSQAIGSGAISGDLLFVPYQGQIIAYQLTTGKQIWSAKQDGEVWGGVAISRGFVVSGTLASKLYCYGLPVG